MAKRHTDRLTAVMEEARKESDDWRHNYIGVEHVLIGILREGGSHAADALREVGITAEWCRQNLIEASAIKH